MSYPEWETAGAGVKQTVISVQPMSSGGNHLVYRSSSQPLIMNEISVCLSKSAGIDL